MKKREWLSLIILATVTMLALLVGIGQIYVTGIDGARLKRPETVWLLFETAVLFCVFFLILYGVKKDRLRLGGLVLVAAGFTWIHQAFLPLMISGLYLVFILETGRMVRRCMDRSRRFLEGRAVTAMADFVLGCGSLILLFCLMSLAGVGSIICTRVVTFVLAVLFLITELKRERPAAPLGGSYVIHWIPAVLLAFILTMLFLQAGRMNICADYDSLHYGLRSEYVLNNGNGLYENLGSINVVYTYSKGLEILLFPISGLPSYGFFLSFQLWMTAGILLVAGRITNLFVSRRYSLLCMALLAAIPGITNMGITAKTDSATALFQLIMIYFLLLYIKRRESCYLVLAVDAFCMTMVLKPTALVFSTAAAGTVCLYTLVTRQLRFRWKRSLWPTVIPMVLMWLLVWLRTWLLTGIPVTSVFYSIWSLLGFKARYPFRFESLPSNGGSPFSKAGIKHMLKRLYGVLVAPVGEDMAHVRIAWGTAFLLIFLVLFLIPLVADMRGVKAREKRPLICLVCVFLTNGAVSLMALYLLWQVDGNYFILLYVLFTILASIVIGKLKSVFMAHLIVKLLVPVALFNVTVTAVSNWGGTLGMSPITLVHKGYYDHRQEAQEILAHYGNEEIWDVLAADGTNRVIVFAGEPEMLRFPCNAQSYTDIEGSGGNFYVSASPEALAAYFEYAKIDYVYLEGGYLKPGSEAWRNVTALMESGQLTEIVYENGNALGRFVAEPEGIKDTGAVLDEFAVKYWAGKQQ